MPPGKGFANTIVAIDTVTRRIAQGLGYQAAATNPAVAQGADFEMLIRSPLDIPISLAIRVFYGSGASIQGFEDTIVSADGTPVEAINFNRIINRPAETEVFRDPTVTVDGTPLIPLIDLPGGEKGANTAGGIESTLFYILKAGTNYLIRLTNNSNTDSNMTISATFAEIIGPLSSGT